MRVVAEPAIAARKVEVAIRPKTQLSTVVIPVRTRDLEQNALRSQVSRLRFIGIHRELANDGATRILLRVENKKTAILLEFGMASEAQQPLFVLHKGLAFDDVEEFLCRRPVRTFAHDDDP